MYEIKKLLILINIIRNALYICKRIITYKVTTLNKKIIIQIQENIELNFIN